MTNQTYQYDSRKIQKGDVFVCLPGGEQYINEAKKNGAADIIKMDRGQMADLAAKTFDYPSKKLNVIGVTGTNGKTTVTHLIHQSLEKAGFKSFILGTINSELTTPESLDIQQMMAEHLKKGGTHFVMEVSSHGIDQGRVANIEFDYKLLTNITQDHLDYHKTFQNYQDTKLRFMKEYQGDSIYPEDYKKEVINFKFPLLGKFNYENIQAACAILRRIGIKETVIKSSLEEAKEPPGRFENIDEGQKFLIIVDYAHTPDGLENILKAVSELARERKGRVLTVFGCGGDRDRKKRPKMGKVTARFSDFFIVTQDNPRTEDEKQIINDILTGISDTKKYKVINNRAAAIKEIISISRENDVVLIAGKGHETYQILKDKTIHFDDRETVREVVRLLNLTPRPPLQNLERGRKIGHQQGVSTPCKRKIRNKSYEDID